MTGDRMFPRTTLLVVASSAFVWLGTSQASTVVGSARAPATDTVRYERQVAPFPVLDSAGTPYEQPFLGGFDVPRPQLVDIDGDGDLDLFVQERSNAVMFFENAGGRLTWRSDHFLDLPVGEWYRFVDIDHDGAIDLLSESPVSYIRAWRNVGTKQSAKFVIAADTLRDIDGAPLPADRQNILNAVDIDCNGRLDLFLGRVAGTVDRYEAVPGSERDGIPRFVLHTARFENIEVLGPIPGQPTPRRIGIGGTRHGANTLAFGDIDGDGDVDLFWGDYFEQGLLWFENRSSGCTAPSMREPARRFPLVAPVMTSGYNAPTIGDVDGNGFLDVIVGVIGGAFTPRTTAVENLVYVSQVAKGEFKEVTRRLVRTLDAGNESLPTLADLDGDGDLDLLIGSKIAPDDGESSRVAWLENVGTRSAPQFRERGVLSVRGEYHYAPSVADLDGDGLPDLVLGTWRDRVQWWRNTGTKEKPAWTLADTALITLTRGSNATPALADLDGDGDLDMIVGEASGQLNFYRNTGTRTAPRFELVSDTYLDIDVGRRSTPALADMDGDGKPDLLLGSEDGGVQLWRNVTVGDAVRFVRDSSFTMPADPYSAPAVGDVNGDGIPEVIVGGISGGAWWYARPKR